MEKDIRGIWCDFWDEIYVTEEPLSFEV